MGQRLAKIAARDGFFGSLQIALFSLGNQCPAAGACAGTNINHMIGKTNGVFIMLDDN